MLRFFCFFFKAGNHRIFSMCEIWITDFQKALTHKLGGRLRAKKKKKKSNKHEANSLPVDIKVAHICKFFFFQSFSGVYHFNLLIDHKRSPEKEKKRSFGCSCSSSSPPLRHVLSSLLTLMVSKWVSHPTLPLSLSPPVIITALYDRFALSALSRCGV